VLAVLTFVVGALIGGTRPRHGPVRADQPGRDLAGADRRRLHAAVLVVRARPLLVARELSGSSIYTLGFVAPPNPPTMVLAFSGAGFGLVLLAMLIRSSIIGGWDRPEQLWRDWGDMVRRHHRDPHLAVRPGVLPLPHREHSWVTASGAVLDGASRRCCRRRWTGWRVNSDRVLLALAALTVGP
jgi:hypothetical protein